MLILSLFSGMAGAATPPADNAQTCSSVDLSKSPGLGEPLNADGTGWCFAYSTADLISFKLHQRVSAFSVATNFFHVEEHGLFSWFTNNRTLPMVKSGGNVPAAFKDAVKTGHLCSEEELPSDYSHNDLYRYTTAVQELRSANDETVSCRMIKKPFPSLLGQEMKDIINNYHGEDRLVALAEASCKHPVSIPPISQKTVSLSKDPDLTGLDQQLDHNNIVSFSHDPGFYYEGPNFTPDKMIYDHQATIVGRKFVNGACMYKVKQDHGRRKYDDYKEPYRDESAGGYVWVDKKTIEKFSESYTYVE